MSSIYWKTRPNGARSLIAQATTPDGKRITTTCATRKEALAWIRSVETPQHSPNAIATPAESNAQSFTAPEMQRPQSNALRGTSAIPFNAPGEEQNLTPKGRQAPTEPLNLSPFNTNGMAVPAEKRSVIFLRQLIDRYIREIMPGKRSTRAPIQQLKTWKRLLGDFAAQRITPEMVARAKEVLLSEMTPGRTPRTPATVNRYLAALSHVFTVACKEWFLVTDNPVMRVRRCKEPRGREIFLSPEQRGLLMDALKPEPELLQVVVLLAIYTGMRHTEIMSLQWRQVDLSRSRLVLEQTKNGKPRGVPLVGPALNAITSWAATHQGSPRDLLFPSPANASKPFDIRRGWNRVRTRMDMPELHFHDLRHCTASYMAMSGATPQEIAKVLGHRTLSMVERYSHLADDHTRPALERMVAKMCREDEETD